MSDKKSTQGAGTPPPSGASEATPEFRKAQDPADAEVQSPATADAAQADADAAPDSAAAADAAPAAGLPDLEAHAEAPAWLSGDGDHDSKVWDGAFEAEPGETAGPVSAAEPEVTNPDDVTLETPSLEEADISSDAAEAASLNDATAEVKEVEAQAADAAVLTDPAANHPAAVNRTEGIAAAAPMTGDSSGTDDAEPAAEGDAKPAAEAEAAAGASAAGDSAPDAPAAAAPADPAESRRSRRTDSASSPEPAGNGRNKQLMLIIGIVGVLAVLVVLFFTVILGNSEKEPGVLEEDVAPIELETGACLQDFAGINEPTTVVTCETPHNAQLVATDTYPDSDEFPGTEALSSRATEICSEVRYSDALAERGDLDLQENKVIPTPESWRDGDRRIDCFVVAGTDQELTESLLEQ